MKALALGSLCSLILVSSTVFAKPSKAKLSKSVKVSYYGLTYVFDDGRYSAYGPLFSILRPNDKKMKVSIRGSVASSSPQCVPVAPQLDLEITDLGDGQSSFEILPTTKVNGKQISETGYILDSFDVMALQPAHSSVHSLAISLGFMNPKDEEDGIELHFSLNELTATMRTRDGDDDSGKVFEVVALKAERNGQKDEINHQITGKCY